MDWTLSLRGNCGTGGPIEVEGGAAVEEVITTTEDGTSADVTMVNVGAAAVVSTVGDVATVGKKGATAVDGTAAGGAAVDVTTEDETAAAISGA